ncbi:MAG: penicillin acylase family protein [Desulfobacterales bacterium]
MELIFGGILGTTVMNSIVAETPLFAFLHGFFDDVLLNSSPAWFGDRLRDDVLRQAIERGLEDAAVAYGKTRHVFIRSLFFGGRLPKSLGFDYGSHEHIGSRATIPQAQIFKAMDQPATSALSYRMTTDLGENILYTNLAGRPSELRFSKYYASGLQEWINGRYHVYGQDEP